MTWWRTFKASSRVKRWRTLHGSEFSCHEPCMILHNKKPAQSILDFWILFQAFQQSLVVRMTDCDTKDAGSIPDIIANVFALIHRLPKNHKRFFASPFSGSLGKDPPRPISKGFYLESLKKLQQSVELKYLLRGYLDPFFGECGSSHYFCYECTIHICTTLSLINKLFFLLQYADVQEWDVNKIIPIFDDLHRVTETHSA